MRKRTFFKLAMVLAATAAQGQGTVNFVNRVTGVLDAPVLVVYGDETYPANSHFFAQLYAAPLGGTLAPVGAPITFKDMPEDGYWEGAVRTIRGVAEGGTAQMKVVAWDIGFGPSYEYALSYWAAQGLGRVGESEVFTMSTGGGSEPPAPMVGLKSFTIVVPYIPEPCSTDLGLLGALALLTWRRPASPLRQGVPDRHAGEPGLDQ